MLVAFYTPNSNENKPFLDQDIVNAQGLISNFPMKELFIESQNEGINIKNLSEINNYKKINLFIFFDFIQLSSFKFFDLIATKIPKILFMREPPSIVPKVWNKKNHTYFDKIYTYDDTLVDNIKYFKFYEPNRNTEIIISKKKINKIIMFSSNKYAYSNNELYSKRKDIIYWFEKNNHKDLDLYGKGWEQSLFENIFFKPLNRFQDNKFFKFIKKNDLKTYRCFANNKKEMLRKYRFSFCLENSITNGYITEKIFDCLYAGVIPLYLGAPNINNYVNKNCFIDLRKFNSMSTLHNYIFKMSDNDYQGYLNNAKKYFNSSKPKYFSVKYCIDHFISIFKENCNQI